MIFRSLDEFDYTLVPANNAPSAGGNGYGDSFPDRALLATATEDWIGGYTNAMTIEGLRCAAGEAAGRSIFQKVATYHGSKASRKILAAPTADFPSWSSKPQPRPETVTIATSRYTPYQTSIYNYQQWLPTSITLTPWECGNDAIYVGTWENHVDTRRVFTNEPLFEFTEIPITTSGRVMLHVRPHFSQVATQNPASANALSHLWHDRATFIVRFIVYYRQDPLFIRSDTHPNRYVTQRGIAGIYQYANSFVKDLAETGLSPAGGADDFYILQDFSIAPLGVSFDTIPTITWVDGVPSPVFHDWTRVAASINSGAIFNAEYMKVWIAEA